MEKQEKEELRKFRILQLENNYCLSLNLFYLETKSKNSGYEGYIHYKNLLLHTCWALDRSELSEILFQRYEIISKLYDSISLNESRSEPKLKLNYTILAAYTHPSGYIITRQIEEKDITTTMSSDIHYSSYLPESKLDWDVVFMYEQKIEILEEKAND